MRPRREAGGCSPSSSRGACLKRGTNRLDIYKTGCAPHQAELASRPTEGPAWPTSSRGLTSGGASATVAARLRCPPLSGEQSLLQRILPAETNLRTDIATQSDRWQFKRDPRLHYTAAPCTAPSPLPRGGAVSHPALRMSAVSLRSLRLRGALALCAAMLIRCSPEISQCIALPGSSVYVLPSAVESSADRLLAIAPQGRAALHGARVALAQAWR